MAPSEPSLPGSVGLRFTTPSGRAAAGILSCFTALRPYHHQTQICRGHPGNTRGLSKRLGADLTQLLSGLVPETWNLAVVESFRNLAILHGPKPVDLGDLPLDVARGFDDGAAGLLPHLATMRFPSVTLMAVGVFGEGLASCGVALLRLRHSAWDASLGAAALAACAPPEAVGTDEAADFLEAAYVRMLEDGLTKFPRAIKSLCRPGALPAVFHCAAGKDRTGMMAMLVLGALEVADEYIVADYALTQDGMARFLQWAVANFPDAYERMTSMPPAFAASVPEAMMRLLGRLRREFGSITNYVLELGVTQGEIDHLREHLLD